jgi:purine-binding chemotaxis protein CheW
MSSERQLCTFTVKDQLFGVEIEGVQELLRHQAMTPVPLSSREIGGLINLRGQIVVAIDLRHLLGMELRSSEELPMNVILRTGDALVSLLVDEIGDVVEVSESSFGTPPETLDGIGRDLIRSVVMLEKHLLLVLDTEKAVLLDSAANT